MTAAEEIEKRATSALHAYQRTDDPLERTRLLREIAGLFVDLREHYLTDTGEPDWRGGTHAYKTTVGEIYRRAGFLDISTISAAVRYHVGNALRERLSPEELDDAGLKADTPRTRSVAKRDRNKALLAALKPGPGQDATPIDPVRAILGASSLLARIDEARLAELSPNQRQHSSDLVEVIAGECARLQRALRPPGE